MTPSPDIRVCLDCGWSEFVIPRAWLAAGWLRSLRPQPVEAEPGMGHAAPVAAAPAITL
ncbi:MAG TPA: hypothetical protein VG722_11315 [Tepidisphaeraceae bacterium]|nr:hypothetical protein [Tepidisphaeraceae bacterium]